MTNQKFPALLTASAVMLLSIGALKLIEQQNIATPAGDNTSVPRKNNSASQSMDDRLSFGDKVLIENEENQGTNRPFREAKSRGVEAMAAGDYATAEEAFAEALANYRNAPETLIYASNAAIGDEPSYTLAIAIPMDNERGDNVNASKELLRGIAQSQQEINDDGGINGTPLRVVIADDDGDKAISPDVAEALAADPAVLGVIGHFSSDASLAAADVYEEQGLVMMSPTSTSVALSQKGDYIFRSLTSDSFNAAALSRHMLTTLDLRKAAIFYNSDSAYSSKLREVFKEKLILEGGKIEAEYDLFAGDFDAQNAVEAAMEEGAETIVLFHNSGVLETALEVIEANEEKLPVLSGDSGYKPEMLELSDYTAGILVATVPWNLLGNENSPFAESSRRLWGADVSWRTATSYDATQALTEAIKRSDNREGIQAALLAPDFSAEGVANEIEFQINTGDRDGAPQLVTVGADGKNFVLVKK